MSFSLFSKSSTPNSPDQPKEEGPSVAKDTTQDSQKGPSGPAKPKTEPASTAGKSEPVVASAGEPEKKGEDASAVKPAPPTNSEGPVSTPPASDASPGAPRASESTNIRPVAITKETAATGATLKGDLTPKSDQGPDPEKVREPEPTAAAGGPAAPGTSETQRQREFLRRRALIIHTRLAKFFAWILLLAFVILPGTFGRVQSQESVGFLSDVNNLPLLAVAYVGCFVNAFAVGLLWYYRKNDTTWLFNNLFFAGLVNSFSGLVTTLVNIFGAQGGTFGTASITTLALTTICTSIYTILAVVFYIKMKRSRHRYQRPRPNSSIV